MIRVSPAFVGLCFLLGACSGQPNDDNTDGAPEPTAGSAGMVGVAGDAPAMGGSTVVGGAPSVAGGGSGGDAVAGSGPEPTLGGSGGTGGAGNTAGSSGSAGSGGKPPIDFSIWALQLPTNTTVSAKDLPTYMGPYFKQAADGGYVLMDPKTGTPTGGSDHPRSELRESNAGGGEAAWTSTGTNIMTVSGQVLLLSGGSSGSTTVAQVFVSGSNTLMELQYNGSKFKVFYEEQKGSPQPTVTLNGSFPMKTKYTFVVGYSANKLTVSINGTVLYTKTPSSAVSGKKFYFKTGNYDQTATDGTPSTTPYTEVEVYTVDVQHS